MSKKIVVYDSGIGGASILKEIQNLMPNYEYIYFADTKNSPYGSKQKNEILKIVIRNILKINKKSEIGMLILACNTASSVCGKTLREIFSFPIICVEPAVKMALEQGYKDILILATQQTLRCNLTIKKFEKKNKNQVKFDKLAIKNLAKEIDENCGNFDLVLPILRKNLKLKNPSCVVVGCTHYNFIKTQLSICLPNSKIISCEIPVARQTQKVAIDNNFCQTKRKLKILLSKRNFKLNRFLKTYLKI